MKIKQATVIFLAAVITLLMSFTVSAESDSVAAFPERLVVLDDEGKSVSDSGEYFFTVENMRQGVNYTKQIQIMNLFEDTKLRVMFRAQPVSKTGEIDLENECICTIILDGETIYSGKVTGEGTPDIRESGVSLGTYKPGESHKLTVNVVWNGTSAGGHIDNGEKVVTQSGTEVLREPSGNTSVSGEVEFKWIFTAERTIDDPVPSDSSNHDSSQPMTDIIQTGEAAAIIIFLISVISVSVLLVLILGKKRKKNENQS